MTRYAHTGFEPPYADDDEDGYGHRREDFDKAAPSADRRGARPTPSRRQDEDAAAPSRTETLQRLAHLRSTIAGLKARDPAEPARPAASDQALDSAVERILRRREQLDGKAADHAPQPMHGKAAVRQPEVRSEARSAPSPRPVDGDEAARGDEWEIGVPKVTAVPDREAKSSETPRANASARFDTSHASHRARAERPRAEPALRPAKDETTVALKELMERFDRETQRMVERQEDQEERLTQYVERGLGGVADKIGERVGDIVGRAEAHLSESGAAMGRDSRAAYDKILGGIGDLTDAFTNRLEHDLRADDIAEIETKLETLTQMLGTIERNVNDAPVLRRVERELRALMDPTQGLEARLEARLAPRLEALDRRLDTASNDAALSTITAKIDTLSEELEKGADPQAIARIEQELATLQDLVWQSARESEETLKQLADRLGDTRPGDALSPILAGIDERLDALQSSLAERAALAADGASAAGLPAYAEEQIDTLVNRIEALVASGGDGPAVAQIEQQLAALTDRIESFAQSASQHGLSREDVADALRHTAEDILHRALERAGSDDGGQAAAAVSQGLAELRSAQELGNKRTVDALETVRHTVERVFSRLEQLEGAEQAAGRARTQPAPVAAPTLAVGDHDDASSFAVGDRLRDARGAAAQDRQHADSEHDMPDDWAPIAPGRRDAQAPSATMAEPATRADFIAAARRAALGSEATEPSGEPDAANANDAKGESAIRKLLRAKGVRPTLLAAAVVILAVASVTAISGGISSSEMGVSRTAEAPVVNQSVATQSNEIAESLVERTTPTTMTVPITEVPADAEPAVNVARLDAIPLVGEPKQFAAHDVSNAGLLAPDASMPGANALEEPMNAASVQSALARDPVEAVREVGPEPQLLASLPEAIGPEALRVAAASGEPKAQYEIARRFGAGVGVAQDDAASVAWLERAATQDLAPAQYRLGSMYEKGTGVEKDVSVARAWYERAAAQGNARAMHNNGVLYAEGAFGEVDFEEAVTWFERAARLGVPDSQFNLGIIYGRGLGVPQDLESSYMWFDASAKVGDKDAAAKRDEVAEVMQPDAVARAKAMSAELVIETPAAETNLVSLSPELTGTPAEAEEMMTPEQQATLIKQVQAVLTHRGFDVGPIDGIPGGRTAKAIEAFREKNGLAAGFIDEALLDALTNG